MPDTFLLDYHAPTLETYRQAVRRACFETIRIRHKEAQTKNGGSVVDCLRDQAERHEAYADG